ncbi:Zinc finger C2HC domain-containing protein 1C [Lepeophtheirus salmonis]|uniref:Zinc finger C2HC domain-containing protein 1C n=1 Tax=Lepeophtheirus salmonis TaxID=72036 RepID=A0A7R8D6L9_LEPSM|nr:Zinc finger C2HC domain-containing protein 1C [Lepeophtheirus salmonis]CAF3045415.1 Zinc finger C2HC domain-containing protein 1C [Lepeophtheirus salmonis]
MAKFQAVQLADRENKLINFLEERQEAAVRRINAGRESNNSANSLTSSSYSSSNNSVNAVRPNTMHSRRIPAKVEKSSPVGWDKSYPLRPVVTPIGYPVNHHLPPARPPPSYGGVGPRVNSGVGGSPGKFNKYSGNYGPKSRGVSLDRSYSELQRTQRHLFMSRTKSSNQLMAGAPVGSEGDDLGVNSNHARNRLRTRRSSSGVIYRANTAGPEEECTNTNTDSGLEQSSYSSQSSDNHNHLSRIVNNSITEPELTSGYDVPPRSNKINTKTFRKNRSSRSISGSPEPPIYSNNSQISKNKSNFNNEEQDDDECENKDPRKALQEQRALLIRKNQEQKQLQEEMQQREKELLRKIQEQQQELELVKKSQIKVASIPINNNSNTSGGNEKRQKPSRVDLSPSKSIINSRRLSTEDLPSDNSRIDRNYLRRKNREDSSSNWDSNDQRVSPGRGGGNEPSPHTPSSRTSMSGMRYEPPSSGRRELEEVRQKTSVSSNLSEGSKTLPSRRKSSSATLNKKPFKSSSTNLSTSNTNLNQTRRSIFQPKARDDLDQCTSCGRNFASDRIEKHTSICQNRVTRKRKKFDMTKKRVQGTEAEAFLKKASKSKKPQKEPKKTDWRKKREEFIAALRAAKEAQRHVAAGGKISDLPPPPPMDTSDYITCPHCNRRFNEAVAERHIPKCKDIRCNKRR